MAMIAALALIVLGAATALAVDIGHIRAVKNHLQRAADAGAFAGARGLWPDVLPVVNSNPPPDCATALTRATTTATNTYNKVDGAGLSTGEVQVQIGYWDFNNKTFSQECSARTNAVRVTTLRNGVNMFFARIMGINTTDLSATAIATMGWASGIGKGALPIAINKRYVIPGLVLFINFSPDPIDNGGWFADPPDPAGAKTFKDYINEGSCPPLHCGEIINLQNGVDTSCLSAIQEKLDERGGTWDTFLPVVDTEKFNTLEPIIGFVSFRITEVHNTGNLKGVTGTILGVHICPGAFPGGENLGLLTPPKQVY
jgi:Flp pilus assembly protein TadG